MMLAAILLECWAILRLLWLDEMQCTSVQCTIHLMEVQDGLPPALREGSIDRAERGPLCPVAAGLVWLIGLFVKAYHRLKSASQLMIHIATQTHTDHHQHTQWHGWMRCFGRSVFGDELLSSAGARTEQGNIEYTNMQLPEQGLMTQPHVIMWE